MTKFFRITNAGTFGLADAVFGKWNNPTTPTEWSKTGSVVVTQSTEPGRVQTGLYSAKIENGGGATDRIAEQFDPVDIGQPLIIKATVYIEAGTFRLQATDNISTVTVNETATGWQELQLSFTPQDDFVLIRLAVPTVSTSVAYVDRVLIATHEVDLIGSDNSPLHIAEYFPSIPDYKNGGIFRSSPLSSGRDIVGAYNENLTQSLVLHLKDGTSEDDVHETLENLQSALERAAAYWYGGVECPYYVEFKPDNVTNTLYAPIVKGRLSELDDPFNITMATYNAIGNSLVMETKQWGELPPNFSKAIEIGQSETFNSAEYGNVDDNGDFEPKPAPEVFVSPRRNTANISHAYHYDDSAATFSSNLQAGSYASPVALLPALTVKDDILYLGCQTSISNSGPFASCVFNVSTGLSATSYTYQWEYWDGVAWSTLTVTDNTDGLQNEGVNVVSWVQPSDWATTAVNSVTGYWVRLYVTTISGLTAVPQQELRKLYAVTWPDIRIPRASVNGAIDALTKLVLTNNGVSSAAATDYTKYNRLIGGYRSWLRGRSFTPVINTVDEQNPSGATVTVGGTSSLVNTTLSPTGRAVRFGVAGGASKSMATQITVTLNDDLSPSYNGRFRVLGRAIWSLTADGTIGSQINVKTASGTQTLTRIAVVETPSVTNDNSVFDYGEVLIGTQGSDEISIEVQLSGTGNTSGAQIDYIDLWFIPVDEIAFDVQYPNPDSLTVVGFVDVDSSVVVDSSKLKNRRSAIVSDSSDLTTSVYKYIGGEISTPSRRGSLVFLPLGWNTTDELYTWANHEIAQGVLLFTNDQYKIGRGSL